MAISAKDVMALRKRTGLGMMECKKALTESDGDADKAIEVLRETLGAKMQERSDREAGEGAIAVAKRDGSIAIVELRSETDFAARNDSFVDATQKIADLALDQPDGDIQPTDAMNELIENLRLTIKENISLARGVKVSGDKVGSYVHHDRKKGSVIVGSGDLADDLMTGICQHIIVADGLGQWAVPIAIDQDRLPADEVEKQKAAFAAEAEATGKPPEIAEKIATGKLRKWTDDNTLLGQIYVREMDAKKPIRDYLPEGAAIQQFERYILGG